MRTLVIGIPLPHPTFDNYSFLSAPCLFDYPRMVVEMAGASRAVEEVVEGSAEHRTLDGEPVVNGPSGPGTLGLADLLRRRRLEAERFLARGGVAVCFAYPDVALSGVEGRPNWRRYDWLPEPEGLRYRDDLVGGYGKLGVELEDAAHPFASYVETFGSRLAYRAYLADGALAPVDGARVFARSPGGAAVGVELPVGGGRVVLLPPFDRVDPAKDRTALATTLFECLERLAAGEGSPPPPEWIRKEAS